MPRGKSYNPLLKSYPDSEKINRCGLLAEAIYTRLIAKSDDNGCYWGSGPMVAMKLLAHRVETGRIRIEDVTDALRELVEVGLIATYTVDGREYLQLLDVFKTLRADVKRDERFPLANKRVSDHVTDAGRTRAVDGTKTARQTQTQTQTETQTNGEGDTPAASPPADADPPNIGGVTPRSSADIQIAELAFPDGLSEQHREAWRQYVDVRRQATGRPWGRLSAETNLTALSGLEARAGPEAAAEAIQRAIAGEYKQIPTDGRHNEQQIHKTRVRADPSKYDGMEDGW